MRDSRKGAVGALPWQHGLSGDMNPQLLERGSALGHISCAPTSSPEEQEAAVPTAQGTTVTGTNFSPHSLSFFYATQISDIPTLSYEVASSSRHKYWRKLRKLK